LSFTQRIYGKIFTSSVTTTHYITTTTILQAFVWDYPGEPVPWEDNRNRCTDNPAGSYHPIRATGAPTYIIPAIFMPDALLVATLPIYPGLTQAPNMLNCIPGGMVYILQNIYQH